MQSLSGGLQSGYCFWAGPPAVKLWPSSWCLLGWHHHHWPGKRSSCPSTEQERTSWKAARLWYVAFLAWKEVVGAISIGDCVWGTGDLKRVHGVHAFRKIGSFSTIGFLEKWAERFPKVSKIQKVVSMPTVMWTVSYSICIFNMDLPRALERSAYVVVVPEITIGESGPSSGGNFFEVLDTQNPIIYSISNYVPQ